MSHEVEEARELLVSADQHYLGKILRVAIDLYNAISDIAAHLDRLRRSVGSSSPILNREFTLTTIPELPDDVTEENCASVRILVNAYNEYREVYNQLLDLQLVKSTITDSAPVEDPEDLGDPVD